MKRITKLIMLFFLVSSTSSFGQEQTLKLELTLKKGLKKYFQSQQIQALRQSLNYKQIAKK